MPDGKISIQAGYIMNDVHFREAEKFKTSNPGAIEHVPGAGSDTFYNLWDKRYKYIQPGIAQGSALALEFMVTAEKNCGISADEFSNFVINLFMGEFGKDNVLSAISGERNTIFCHFIIMPLDGRILNSGKWYTAAGINEKFHDTAIGKIAAEFNIETEKKEKKEDGYSPELEAFKGHERLPEDKDELVYDTIEKERQEQSDMAFDILHEISNTAIQYFTVGAERRMFEQAQRGEISPEAFAKNVRSYLLRYHPDMTENDIGIVLRKMDSAVFGNYVLDQLIADEAISDIKVLSPKKIRVKAGGRRKTSNLTFIDMDDYIRFIKGIAIRNRLDLSANAVNKFTDKVSSDKFIMRFNITTNYINSVPYPYLHIRKVRKSKYTMQELIKYGMLDQKLADFLIWQAKNAKGIVFTGKGASGKTTLMNVLLDYIPFSCSGLVIQEAEELFTKVHPDLMFQHVVLNKKNQGLQYTLKDLAINGLLTDLDYFIIGEIKGEEAMYFMNAAATGHKCWCSVHSPSSVEAIDKLADYVMYESKYNKAQAMYMLKELQYIVFMKDFKIHEISEIVGWDHDKDELVYKSIYRRDAR